MPVMGSEEPRDSAQEVPSGRLGAGRWRCRQELQAAKTQREGTAPQKPALNLERSLNPRLVGSEQGEERRGQVSWGRGEAGKGTVAQQLMGERGFCGLFH